MKEKQIIIMLIILLLNITGRTWREFSKYYLSLAYASFFNAFYYYLCKRCLLWEFPPQGIPWRILRGVHIFLVVPLLVLACLSKFPNSLSKQIVHLIKWIVASCFVELFAVKNNLITFKHGWNILWSGLIYLTMYGFSYLHTKKPLLTWLLSFCSVIFFIVKFKIPLEKRLVKGPFFFFTKKDTFHVSNFKL
jgi:hypothetical protein